MRLIGFNFTKISAERFKTSLEKSERLKFNTKIDISSIEPLKSDLLKIKEDVLKINFTYTVLYEPKVAEVEIKGEILLSVEPKIAKDILKGWKDKETSNEFRIFIFNIIFKKSNIKCLQLEDELGLPSHIPMPTLNAENNKKE